MGCSGRVQIAQRLASRIAHPSARAGGSLRTFSTTVKQTAQSSPLGELGRRESKREDENLALSKIFGIRISSPNDTVSNLDEALSEAATIKNPRDIKKHHFHVYATKHNCHITLTNNERDSLMSFSAGNIGFRKAARGTYDAAYQLAAYTLGRIYEGGLLNKIKNLEVVLRGFGVGREAVTKALLGAEGRLLRSKIVQVSDATRLKFGGTRSKKPRRLG